MKKKLIVLIGCSGSGKSTYTEEYVRQHNCRDTVRVCSADHYFLDEKGNYNFDYTKIKEAHAQCQANARKYLNDDDVDTVIIDNTNVRKIHRKIYEDIAAEYNALYVPTIMSSFDKAVNGADWEKEAFAEYCAKMNLHNVPYDVILRTIKNYD